MSGPLSILVLTNMYPPHHLGGYELSCHDVVRRWEQSGHRVSVLTTTMTLPDVTDPDPAAVHRDLTFYWDDHVLTSPRLLARWKIERENQRALRRRLQTDRPDVISVWNMGAMSLSLLTTVHEAGIPAVLVVCDDWPSYGPRLDAWTRLFSGRPRIARLVRMLGRVPTGPPDLDAVGPACFVSDFTLTRARTASQWRFPNATVVYSGIEPSDFPLSPRDDTDVSTWRSRLLYVGRLDPRKGIETLIRSIALLPSDTTLEVVGRGPDDYLAQLHELVRAAGAVGRVVFRVLDRSELRDTYRRADAFVFPSEWDEPFGLVPVEAMACGVPVVATGTGGSAEFMLDRTNCLRYPPGDAEGLAAAISELTGDPGLRRALIAGGLRTARDLSVDRLAAVLEEWHRAAASRLAGGLPPERHLDIA